MKGLAFHSQKVYIFCQHEVKGDLVDPVGSTDGKGCFMSYGLKRTSILPAALLVAAAVHSPRLWGQFTSSMEGLVTDATGAAIPGATVTLVNNATGVKMNVATTSAGYYLFPSL